MANSEDSLVDELREQLKKSQPLAFCYKLHGGPFQPGLPDLLLAMERKAALIEAKWANDADFEKPLLEVFDSKLTDKQAFNLGAVGMLDGPLRARLLIGGALEHEDLPAGKGTLAVAFDLAQTEKIRVFHTLNLLEIAYFLMDLRKREPVNFPPAPLLQMQIRGQGETWNAAYLLGGIQYCGPIDCTKDKDKTFEGA